jgi:hypothetical protein
LCLLEKRGKKREEEEEEEEYLHRFKLATKDFMSPASLQVNSLPWKLLFSILVIFVEYLHFPCKRRSLTTMETL